MRFLGMRKQRTGEWSMGEKNERKSRHLMKKEQWLANTVSFRYYKTFNLENNRQIDVKWEWNSAKLQYKLLETTRRGKIHNNIFRGERGRS